MWKIDNKNAFKKRVMAPRENLFFFFRRHQDGKASVGEIWYHNILSSLSVHSIITKVDALAREYVAMILSSIWAQSHKFFLLSLSLPRFFFFLSYVQNIPRKHKFALKWVVKQKHHQSLNEHGEREKISAIFLCRLAILENNKQQTWKKHIFIEYF